jgi:hypothetical protein
MEFLPTAQEFNKPPVHNSTAIAEISFFIGFGGFLP